MTSSETRTCGICSMKAAVYIFKAQCSHIFHWNCINPWTMDGNSLCPVCEGDLTSPLPPLPAIANRNSSPQDTKPLPPLPPPPLDPDLAQFSDDEPLPAVTTGPTSDANLQNVSLWAVPERNAVAASESVANFSVLVGLRALPLSEEARAPIDLVTVLDVSGSMVVGQKLDLVKRAVCFVIDSLGPSDRLSIVSFSTNARRVFPLRRMTERGRVNAKLAVNSLRAEGMTDIVKGLTKGVRVLEERKYRNPVASIMFLSDGRDNFNLRYGIRMFSNTTRTTPAYIHLLPASIRPDVNGGAENEQTIPVHAFGFGTDHDPVLMHAISDASGGTFSFIESFDMVQGAFAGCIGGLLSVMIRELHLSVRSASRGVNINSIPSGNCASEISDQGSRGKITVGDLYADEEKEFLINVSVPVYARDEDEGNERTTSLLDVMCSYKDVLSNERVQMEFAEIRRPGNPLPSDVKVKLEVDRQKNRVNAAEGYAEAARVAETGDLKRARAILSKKRSSLLASESGRAGDGLSLKLEAEMKETEDRMGSRQTYEQTGRALALSNISAHANQRATTRRRVGEKGSADTYVTPNMAIMVSKAQQIVKIEDDIKMEKD